VLNEAYQKEMGKIENELIKIADELNCAVNNALEVLSDVFIAKYEEKKSDVLRQG